MTEDKRDKNQTRKLSGRVGKRPDGDDRPHWLSGIWSQGPDRQLELLLSFAIALFAAVQIGVTIWNDISTSNQVDKIITAANGIKGAADNFSNSASDIKNYAGQFSASATRINAGVGDAVGQLQSQVERMDAAREAANRDAQNALKATIDNFHRDQRAWLNVTAPNGFPKIHEPYSIRMLIHNSGRTPAKNVVIKFNMQYLRKTAVPTFPFWGTPVNMGSAAPSQDLEFNHFGSGFEMDIAGHQNEFLYAYGTITYDDAFGDPHWTTYCFFTYNPNTWGYCKIHNDIGDGKEPTYGPVFQK